MSWDGTGIGISILKIPKWFQHGLLLAMWHGAMHLMESVDLGSGTGSATSKLGHIIG